MKLDLINSQCISIMEEYSSCSGDSGTGGQDSKDSVVPLLDQYKIKISEFSQPNLAKSLATSDILTQSQINQLEKLEKLTKSKLTTKEIFVSIVREISDIRSFRILLGHQIGTVYDFSLMCLDIYFHSFNSPSVVLRTGLGESNLSIFFEENGSLSNNFWGLEMELYDTSCENYLKPFFSDLHAILFIHDRGLHYLPQFLEKEVPTTDLDEYQNLLKYGCLKYAIYENLKNPMPELADAIISYYTIYKANLKLHLDMNSPNEGSHFKFKEGSIVYLRNPYLMKLFQELGYNTCLSNICTDIRELLDSLPTPFERFGIDIVISAPVILTEASQNDPQPPESSTLYFQTLKDLRFNNADFYSKKKHALLESIGSEGNVNTNRLSKEVKVLSQHLPCETTGAIFVVMDSERMDLLKVLISGTEDTPYTHGLYEFHIACPSEYPKKPPLVSIVTTGNGKVRFNPNLYDDGYVCLSVINTWDGDPSER